MTGPHDNPRNNLDNFLRGLGVAVESARSVSVERVGEQTFVATVVVRMPDDEVHQFVGECTVGKGATTMDACQKALTHLEAASAAVSADWAKLALEAQAGDALIKLSAYLDAGTDSAADASAQLQRIEADAHLAQLYDRWRADGDEFLGEWGENLSEKRKATLVEALLWRRFGHQVLRENAAEVLGGIRRSLAE